MWDFNISLLPNYRRHQHNLFVNILFNQDQRLLCGVSKAECIMLQFAVRSIRLRSLELRIGIQLPATQVLTPEPFVFF